MHYVCVAYALMYTNVYIRWTQTLNHEVRNRICPATSQTWIRDSY